MNESVTLTRYLYIKEDVLMSLLISILEKDYDQSLFWTSELYFSGYEQEVIEYIYAIYKNLFYSNNPKLKRVMDIGLQRFDKGIHIATTMILNLTSKARKFTLQDFMVKNKESEMIPNAKEKETNLIIFSNVIESNKYNLYVDENSHNRLILKNACKYQVRKEWVDVFECSTHKMSQIDVYYMITRNWLYYASSTPLWNERIEQYHGTIDECGKKIHFENEDDFEEFYEKYEYDLDEQDMHIQTKIFGPSILKKFNINDLYKKYEPGIKIQKRKLKRVNDKCSESK
jgi:hypothetical protein